jgi:DNA invertase Pin-like site-specific DNA recombinase
MNLDKVTDEHRQRRAVVYVRQSSTEQLRHNHESRRRQYELADRARQMGWSAVEVIDEDLGRSGASAVGRTGFQRLVSAVGLREVGAVFSLEASRLARNNRDWYELIDLCALRQTLIVDFDGVYDPRLLNDRLLLGLKGTMSEFELGLLRQRALEAARQKAARGELFYTVPVGFVLSRDGRCEQDPDERVRHAIHLVFERFGQSGSVHQVLAWFHEQDLLLPAVHYRQGVREVVWRPATFSGLHRILTNPIYGGAYAYGQRMTVTRTVGDRTVQVSGKKRPPEEWPVLLPNRLPGYVSWERYQDIQRQIKENGKRVSMHPWARGAAEDGPALLAGLLRCRRCGRRLCVHYGGSNGRLVRYECIGERFHLAEARCIAFGGARVDKAVEAEVLRALEPAALEAALEAMERLQQEPSARRRSLELSVQQARYEAERARRQYDQVEPENRLVAAELERRWNAALQELARLEGELARLPGPEPTLTDAERSKLLALAQDFPTVWREAAGDMRRKKQLVRLLIEEIVVDILPDPPRVHLVIRWAGGAHTELHVRRYRTGEHRYATDEETVELVRRLAEVAPDQAVVGILNRLAIKTTKGNTWTAVRLRSFRSAHHIPVFDPDKPRDWLTMREAAERLQVSAMTVRRLITTGILPARQIVPNAPWMIAPDALRQEAVQCAARAAQQGNPRPLPRHPGQLTLVPQGL